MRKFTLSLLAVSMVFWSVSAMAQIRPVVPKVKKDFKALKPGPVSKDDYGPSVKPVNNTVANKSVLDDPSLMLSRYDLQTNSSTQNRIYLYPDGTIGATGMMAHSDGFADRGTGYNYFDGTSWGAMPSLRIENERTGWPSYAPFGATGEIVVAHTNTTGLKISTRTVKGQGTWDQVVYAGPSAAPDISWPRVTTNGPNHTNIHIIACTYQVYQGLNFALLYSRSQDGGVTWDIQNQIIAGMTSTEYNGFGGDAYNWATPKGDTLCFVVGDNWNDEFIMKSTDNGTTWTKTKIWTCAYDKWPGTTPTDTFYCPDGSNSVALDKNGQAHVVFGLQRALGDNTGAKFWFPFTDGLIYWHEGMPELPQDLDTATLIANGNYIGWVQDTNVWYAAASELAYYYMSMSSMPTIATDDANNVFVIWSSVTNLRDPNSYMLRHLFARASVNGGATWRDTIVELTHEFFQYNFEECVYPSVSPTSTATNLFINFQGDIEAGVYLNGMNGAQGQTDIDDNNIIFLNPTKNSIINPNVGVQDHRNNPSFVVLQNFPNPVKGSTTIGVNTLKPGQVNLQVDNILGQHQIAITRDFATAGVHNFTIDASQFSPGVYFYTVTIGNESITKKMIIE
jgi:hypothetical protein